MVSAIHFDPTQTSAPMEYKLSIRVVTSIAADKGWPLEHLDMASAYIHTDFKYDKEVYIKEPPRVDGTYLHGRTVGRLKKNIYGGKSGSYFFLKQDFQFLMAHGFIQAEGDECLL